MVHVARVGCHLCSRKLCSLCASEAVLEKPSTYSNKINYQIFLVRPWHPSEHTYQLLTLCYSRTHSMQHTPRERQPGRQAQGETPTGGADNNPCAQGANKPRSKALNHLTCDGYSQFAFTVPSCFTPPHSASLELGCYMSMKD